MNKNVRAVLTVFVAMFALLLVFTLVMAVTGEQYAAWAGLVLAAVMGVLAVIAGLLGK